jgi:hypothetical protein
MSRCGDCKYFKVTFDKEPIKGECHYHPPKPESVMQQGAAQTARTSIWPLVRGEDFCSKFEGNS